MKANILSDNDTLVAKTLVFLGLLSIVNGAVLPTDRFILTDPAMQSGRKCLCSC